MRCCLALIALLGLTGCPEEATDPQAAQGADAGGVDAAPPLDRYDAPAAPIEIITDDLGIPHIYAQSDLDAFFGAGYQQGVDRLFAIDLSRRAAVGRLAEALGPDSRGTDVQSRTLGFAGLGEATVDALAAARPADHDLLVAFVGGLNRRVAEVLADPQAAPPGYATFGFHPTPFTASELMAIGVRIQFGFSSTLEFDLLYTVLLRLVPDAHVLPVFAPVGDAFIMGAAAAGQGAMKASRPGGPPLDPAALGGLAEALRRYRRDLGVGEGSNCWAVSGQHTDNGRPILANDSHSRLRDPNAMYPYHLDSASAGGAFDAMGMAFLGVPGIHVGHNRHVVWGATTHFADALDLWDVQVDGDEALLGAERVPVERRTEVIAVRQPDGSLEETTLEVETIPGRGVLLPAEMLPLPVGLVARGKLMLAWPGLEATTDLFVFLDLNRARDLDAFAAAVDQGRTGMQNWTAASAEGIRYHTAGLIADRGPLGARAPANRVMDAADAATLWRGWLVERFPRLAGGDFISSANNDPWGHTADNDPLNDAFYYGSFFAPGYRAARLQAALRDQVAAGGVSVEATQALQMEVFSPFADRLVPLLDEAMAGLATDEALAPWRDRPDVAAAAAALSAWDRQMVREATAPALFRVWAAFLARRTLADDLSLLFDAIDEAQPVYVTKFTLLALEQGIPELLDGPRSALLVGALADAVDALAARGHPTWGDLHRAELTRADGTTRLLATPGGDSSLNVAQSRCLDGAALAEHCVSESGAVYRMVTRFTAEGTPEVFFNCPACLPDADADWVEGRYHRLPFARAEVEARAASTRTVLP